MTRSLATNLVACLALVLVLPVAYKSVDAIKLRDGIGRRTTSFGNTDKGDELDTQGNKKSFSVDHDDDSYEFDDEYDVASGKWRGWGGDPMNDILPNPHMLVALFNPEHGGYIGGHAIRPSRSKVIMHESLCLESEPSHGSLVVTPTNRLDSSRPLGGVLEFGCSNKNPISLGGGINVYNISTTSRANKAQKELFASSFKAPLFQNNASVTGPCHMETYTADENSGFWRKGGERQFSYFPVVLDCTDDDRVCEGYGSGGGVCYYDGDLGAPIYCGKDRVLSFLVNKIRGVGQCSVGFNATRLADNFDYLNKLKD